MAKKKNTVLEDKFAYQLDMLGVSYTREFKLFEQIVGAGKGIRKRLQEAGLKNYRFDFKIEETKLLIEIQGGIWLSNKGKKSAHSTGSGQERDMDKSFKAYKHGWDVLQINAKQISSGEISVFIKDKIIKEKLG
jgi:very-short-patch-repair endonuclease